MCFTPHIIGISMMEAVFVLRQSSYFIRKMFAIAFVLHTKM